MREKQLYTFGYLASSGQRVLHELIALAIPIVDIRLSPTSRHYGWMKEQLEQRPGITYYWLRDLGNDNYKQAINGAFHEPRIQLHNEEAGLQRLAALIDQHGTVALMCACSSKKLCHRILVASKASAYIPGLQVKHL